MPKFQILIIFLALILLPEVYYAQAKPPTEEQNITDPLKKRGYIGFSLGPSIPIGKFSNKSNTTQESGFAKNGFHLNYLDAGFRFTSSLGAKLYLFNASHPIEYESLRRSRSQIDDLSYISASGSDYELKGALLGISAIKVEKDYDLGINFMMGFANVFLPGVQLNYRDQSSNQEITKHYSAVKKQSFGAGLGFDLRIHIREHLDFLSNVNYTIFQNEFDQQVESNGQIDQIKIDLGYEVFSINFGLAYRFFNE